MGYPGGMTDAEFEAWFTERIAELPGVLAVALGGSRARGAQRPDSDWDFALYYRGHFDPRRLRAQGWQGQFTEVGGWPGAMNGGGSLWVGQRQVDLHYRDLDDIDHRWQEAEQGRFEVQWMAFYLAGMPSYLPLGELAWCRVLFGQLPRPPFPQRLREQAARRWHDAAAWSLRYAQRSLLLREDVVVAAASLTRGLIEESHARLAARGEWVLNEKNITQRAGLDDAAEILKQCGLAVPALGDAVVEVGQLLAVEM